MSFWAWVLLAAVLGVGVLVLAGALLFAIAYAARWGEG